MADPAASAQPALRAEAVSLGYGNRPVIERLDLAAPPGQLTAIVGPNACGKSTLLRALARLLSPTEGRVVLDGKDLHRLPTKQLARHLGLLPQSPKAPDGIVVADLVARGRHPHQGWLGRWSAADDAAVAEALALTATTELHDRVVDELSGGQRQRVWIAMALAQGTSILLLDEPTTYLDVRHQVEVLDLLVDLIEERGTTVVMVLHELNLAVRYANHLVCLAGGALRAAGPPDLVVTEELIREVFDMDNRVVVDPVTGGPLVVPVGRHRRRVPHGPASE